MIGPLAKIIRTSNLFKTVLRLFCKVWHNPNFFIFWFDWLIALYLLTSLPRNTSFLIIKHSCVREGRCCVFSLDITSTNTCARTSFCWVCNRFHHLWSVHLPNWNFFFHLTPHVCSRRFPTLEIWQYSVTGQVHRKS